MFLKHSTPRSPRVSTSAKIYLNFDGYFSDPILAKIPNSNGIFCVYRGKFNVERSAVSTHQLLYIGESTSVRQTIASHPLRSLWLSFLDHGEELCYTYAPVLIDRKRAADALIHQHLPIGNVYEKTQIDHHPVTEISLSGRIQLLNYSFLAFRQESLSLKQFQRKGRLSRLHLQNWVEGECTT